MFFCPVTEGHLEGAQLLRAGLDLLVIYWDQPVQPWRQRSEEACNSVSFARQFGDVVIPFSTELLPGGDGERKA